MRFEVTLFTWDDLTALHGQLCTALDSWVDKYQLPTSDRSDCRTELRFATFAREGGRIRGAHFYELQLLQRGYRLDSSLTYVTTRARKSGLAERLWSMSLAAHDVRSVHAVCISAGGLKLMRRVRRTHPHIRFTLRNRSWLN